MQKERFLIIIIIKNSQRLFKRFSCSKIGGRTLVFSDDQYEILDYAMALP
jgi:hypothetical protein